MKKFVSVLLSLLLCSTLLVGCGNTSVDVYQMPEYTPKTFEEMVEEADTLYDEEAAIGAIDQLNSLCEQKNSFKSIEEAYNTIVEEFNNLATTYIIAMIQYNGDVTNEEIFNKYCDIQVELTNLQDDFYVALNKVLHSDYRDQMITYINDDKIVKDADDYEALDDEYINLSLEESDLIQEYVNALNGSEASLADYEQYYLDLLDNRIAQVQYLGDYDSYVEYAYKENYFRDYEQADLNDFYQWVKDYVVPEYILVNQLIKNYPNQINEYYSFDVDQNEIVERAQPFISTISDKAKDTFQMMLDDDLIDFSVSTTKMQVGYTSTLFSYGVPYIFYRPSQTAYDIETIIHEFGHYYESYVNMEPALYNHKCIDICEIDSQGMEMLMLEYADEIYGEDLGDVSQLLHIYNLLSLIILGSVYNEFETTAFEQRENGTITSGDQLTDLYLEIESSYLGEGNQLYGEYWYEVSHIYRMPCYYISYATSAAAALSILAEAQEDYSKAVDTYNALIEMGTEQGYVNTVETLGLPNPFTTEGEELISQGVDKCIQALAQE